MKNFFKFLIIMVCLLAVGYGIYEIIDRNSILYVQIEGEMQTIYFVGDDIDFQDAKLNVVYKNGKSKKVSLNKAKINNFTTKTDSLSGERRRSLTISYKNADSLAVEYSVLPYATFYVDNDAIVNNGAVRSSKHIGIDKTDELIEFLSSGKLRYYSKKSYDWYLFDGNYDSTYYFSIKDDKLNICLGGSHYDMLVNFNNGVEFISYYPNGNMNLKSLKFFSLNTSAKATASEKIDEVKAGAEGPEYPYTYKIVKFEQGQSIGDFNKTSKSINKTSKSINLKIEFDYPLVNLDDGIVVHKMIYSLYLRVTDSMVSNFSTNSTISSPVSATIRYSYNGQSLTSQMIYEVN